MVFLAAHALRRATKSNNFSKVFTSAAYWTWPFFSTACYAPAMRFWCIAAILSFGCQSPSSNDSQANEDPAVQQTQESVSAAQENSAKKKSPTQNVSMDIQVRDLIRAGKVRQQCNDLTGCPMIKQLTALGHDACKAIYTVYQSAKSDKFWRFRLIEAISRIGGKDAGPLLAQILVEDKFAAAKIEAALGIGRLRAKKQRAVLMAAAEQFKPQGQRGALLAVGYALARIGEERGRTIIDTHLVVPKQTVRWDILRPGVYAANMLRMKSLQPRIEEISARADPFVRREAVIALKNMRDVKAVPSLIQRLQDKVPGVRHAAQDALVALTGYRHKRGFKQWQQWWQQKHNKKKPLR